MTTHYQALESMDVWARTPDVERRTFGAELTNDLGEAYEFVGLVTPHKLVEIRHGATAISFVAVPGGRFVRGISADEERDILALASPSVTPLLIDEIRKAQPAAEVQVEPFLVARAPVLASTSGTRRSPGPSLFDGAPLLASWDRATRPDYGVKSNKVPMAFTRAEVARILPRVPFRASSETEWEYVARLGGDGHWLTRPEKAMDAPSVALVVHDCIYKGASFSPSTNALGLWGLLFGEWTTDDQHALVAHGGAASMYPWQHGAEFYMAHAGARHTLHLDSSLTWNLRFACSLPR